MGNSVPQGLLSRDEGFIPILARIWQGNGVTRGRGRGRGHAEGQETANVNKRPLVIFQGEELKEDIFGECLEERPAYLSKQMSGK
ncbi:hypothetical protein Leryth_004878 [Lithospermum erythrorhizon]|nr:hypothetical protein Leryth_004878 [Lithospermum erythrorhizon]